jgi:hypothetical protein
LKHFYNCGFIILKHNNQQLTTKMNSKITKQDIAVGRIYRCSVCDAKCDDTWGTKKGKMVCGRFVEKDNSRVSQCSKDCNYKYMRDETREKYEDQIHLFEKELPRLIEGLKIAVKYKFERTNIIFKIVKHHKMNVKLLKRYISRQMTLAEIQAEFYTLSRLGMEIAEDWLEIYPNATETYMDWVDISAEASKLVKGDHHAKTWSVDYC